MLICTCKQSFTSYILLPTYTYCTTLKHIFFVQPAYTMYMYTIFYILYSATDIHILYYIKTYIFCTTSYTMYMYTIFYIFYSATDIHVHVHILYYIKIYIFFSTCLYNVHVYNLLHLIFCYRHTYTVSH